MSRLSHRFKKQDGILVYPPPLPTVFSSSSPYSINYEQEAPPSSSFSRISPVLLLTIIILAVIFFIYGVLHLVFRCLMKRPISSPIYQSNRHPETSGSQSLQRQLQQLFRLHDSGLDQVFIDALPVFDYKDIMGLKEPFDCAVCLCEFSDNDKLRLLPLCSHAFHIDCIDTWLLSNSTCPLCRGTLMSPGHPIENPVFNFDISNGNGHQSDGESGISCGQKPVIMEEVFIQKVFSVRLGKLRSLNHGEMEQGETSSCNLDARRCYSMGSFQYVVGNSDLQVALCTDTGGGAKLVKVREHHWNSSVVQGMERKKISGTTKGESFSVSKIWLWSKKSKFPTSSDTRMTLSSSLDGGGGNMKGSTPCFPLWPMIF